MKKITVQANANIALIKYWGKRDKKLFWKYLVKEGLMAFHDTNTDKMTDYGKCGVKKFWQELEGEKITFNQSAGLGIIQKNG